jgi:uncharacterized protein YegL
VSSVETIRTLRHAARCGEANTSMQGGACFHHTDAQSAFACYVPDVFPRLNGGPQVRTYRTVAGHLPTHGTCRVLAVRIQRVYLESWGAMSKLSEFTVMTARPLPVLLLADVSGSMRANDKIDSLNEAVSAMLGSFRDEDDSRAEIHLAIITFGDGGAKVHQALAPVSRVEWTPMTASGQTPMGAAFDTATKMIEDRDLIPSRAYTPAIVLVSDGVPTDDWELPLRRLLTAERTSKAARFTMGIGDDADVAMLSAFLDSPDARVYRAHEARQVKNFFRWVTMSVTHRSRSVNPNTVVAVEPTDLDELDF